MDLDKVKPKVYKLTVAASLPWQFENGIECISIYRLQKHIYCDYLLYHIGFHRQFSLPTNFH